MLADGKGEIVAARFIANPEIAAGLPPGDAMRRDSPARRAKLREQMRQFMAQRPIDFIRAVVPQTRVQGNNVAPRIRPAGRAEEARVPFHVKGASKLVHSERSKDFPRPGFQSCIATQHHKSGCGRKNEVELLLVGSRIRLQ